MMGIESASIEDKTDSPIEASTFDEELVIDDYREQGFTMDWKIAGELYKKIMEKARE